MSHWIWFIFPQPRGLGKSTMSWEYGLTIEEARSYLEHPVLSLRLRHIIQALLTHAGEDIVDIMGSRLDSLKLQASMTLFDSLSPADVFEEVLDVFYDGQRHEETLILLNDVQE